ncbi:uncharacterized protein G2W53_044442 [Senna tora]|uniref:DUF4216 domain-containing protein n=1 Tax=Senna tora TaxID=362788 RepID=A0A834SDA7_9FABA|nr:uncharacterized protein G2W53_044442 [Senna tora]
MFNCDDVQQYIREHEDIVIVILGKEGGLKPKVMAMISLNGLFETRAMNDDISDFVKGLSRGPNTVAKKFSGYVINGYRFHTGMRDGRCKTQNGGVTVEAISRIFHFDKRCYQEDPFVLATQVHQCFYIRGYLEENGYYVMKRVPRDLFNMGDQSDGGQEFHWGKPSDSSSNPTLPVDDGEVDLGRTDVPATIIDEPLPTLDDQPHEIDYEEDSDFDDSDWDYM